VKEGTVVNSETLAKIQKVLDEDQRLLEQMQLDEKSQMTTQDRSIKINEKIEVKLRKLLYLFSKMLKNLLMSIDYSQLYPVGKKAIEAVNKAIEDPVDNEPGQIPIDQAKLQEIFDDWKLKKRHIRKYKSR